MARKTVECNISFDDVRKVYYVNMSLSHKEGGKRTRQYRTYPTLQEARAGLHEFQAGRIQWEQPLGRQMTLSQWLDYWMTHIVRPNRAETTAYAYQNIIDKHLNPILGDRPLAQLSPKDIQQYYFQIRQNCRLSSNTLKHHHDLLSSALRAAVRQNILPCSPLDRVETPRFKQNETAFYSPEEMKRLYTLLEGHRLEVPVRLAGSLGLRREELCGLKWKNVDFQQQLVFIREARTTCGASVVQKDTKNPSSVRTLFMPEELACLLARELERQRRSLPQASEYVVLDRRGKPYSPNALSLAFTRFVSSRGLPQVTLHGLRHSFATAASFQGISLFDIGKALGHASPSTTGRIYTHLIDRTHRETVMRVSDALR